MSAAVIIPARFGSTRFPGKPLARGPDGRTLIQYVWEAACRAEGVAETVVATDDERIASAVREFGGVVRMTGPGHPSGSDRCAEAAAGMAHGVIVNLQGDEPSIPPEAISQAIRLLDEDEECVVGTLATRILGEAELSDPGVVKVVMDERGYALYFSRSVIPHVRGSTAPLMDSPWPHLRHLGIYAFRHEFLRRYAGLAPHPLEEAEKLEQLRVLAHGYKIKVGLTGHRPMKVDTPEDFEVFCRWKSRPCGRSSRE
jgi:3-deoxy-manno-octulosonate cytidylyltransferase (CMP-KDO synthetase)